MSCTTSPLYDVSPLPFVHLSPPPSSDEDLYSPDEDEKDQAEDEDPDFEVKPKKISLIKRDDGKTKTLRDIKCGC